MLEAVIFDMDGVLVDSFRPHFESWRALAAEQGLSIRRAQFAESFGRTSREIVRALWGGGMPDERIEQLDHRKEALYREIVARDFPTMDGASELIDALHDAGVALAVGSSGPPENVDVVLDGLQRRGRFAAVVTGRDVTHGKPHPEVFRIALRRLGARPESSVVVEDAPAGIEAAHRAGMPAVALLSTGRSSGQFRDAAPELIVSSLRELSPRRLADLLSGRRRTPARR